MRDYLYVEDLADGLVRLAGYDWRLPESLNFAGSERHPLLDVVTTAVRLVGSGVAVQAGVRPGKPGDRPVFLGDSRRAEAILGWRPVHDLDFGMAKTVAWYRDHRELWDVSA